MLRFHRRVSTKNIVHHKNGASARTKELRVYIRVDISIVRHNVQKERLTSFRNGGCLVVLDTFPFSNSIKQNRREERGGGGVDQDHKDGQDTKYTLWNDGYFRDYFFLANWIEWRSLLAIQIAQNENGRRPWEPHPNLRLSCHIERSAKWFTTTCFMHMKSASFFGKFSHDFSL